MGNGAEREDSKQARSVFEGRLVRLRAMEEEDIVLLSEMFWDPEVTRFLMVVWPEPRAGFREWWEKRRRDEAAYLFAIETLAGEPVGVCDMDVWRRSRTGTVGIWIGRRHWEKGYGTDAVRVLCRFGFREASLERIQLEVFANNPRGKRAYEKVGFKEEGRRRRAVFIDGRYDDVIGMGLLRDELIEDEASGDQDGL